jgi:hypothetical protein
LCCQYWCCRIVISMLVGPAPWIWHPSWRGSVWWVGMVGVVLCCLDPGEFGNCNWCLIWLIISSHFYTCGMAMAPRSDH